MTVIDVLRAGHAKCSNITGRQQTGRVVHEGTRLPAEGRGIVHEIATSPRKPEKGSPRRS